MSYGHPTRARWGESTLGVCFPQNLRLFRVDSSVRICPDKSFSVDSLLGQRNREGLVLVDSTIRSANDASFSVDVFDLRLPTDLYRLQETHPIILIELRLRAGTVRVSNRNVVVGGDPFTARLVNASGILRTITEGTDEVQISLDDTDTRGPRFRDLFAANAPEGRGVSIWIGLTDDPDFVGNRIHLFEGKIERVPGFTRSEVSLDAVRNEIIDDRLIGRLVTLAEFPDAPTEVLGTMVPIAFGRVGISKGVVINTNALGRLFFNHFIADTTIKLTDSTSFPSAGTIQIADEQITYTSKLDAAGELTGAVRGANGTIASDHAKDTEVRELGPFVVKFHDGASAAISEIKILDPQGNLGEPVPPPTSIDHDLATATWDELPRIRSVGVESLFHRVHFNAAEAGNLAPDAAFAARENAGYDTFEFAKVSPGVPLKIRTNTTALGQPGDIKRVWIAVVHDSAPLGSAVEEVQDGSGFVKKSDGEVAEGVVFQQIFDFVAAPDGGFTNATLTAERVRSSIDNDAVSPAQATFDEMTRPVNGVPFGYDQVFATQTSALVLAAVAAEQVLANAHDANLAAAQTAASAAASASIAAGATVTFPAKAPAAFQLVAEDLTPIEIARFDDKTNDRLYDVEVQTDPPRAETKTIVATTQIETAGIWSNAPKCVGHALTGERENAESIFDGSNDETGDAQFNIPGEANAGDGPGFAARVKFLDQEESASSGFKVASAFLRVFVNTVTTLGYIYAPLFAYLETRGGRVPGSEVRCQKFNEGPGGIPIATGCLLAPAEFFSNQAPHGDPVGFDISVIGNRMQNLKNMRMVLEPGSPTGPDPTQPITCLNFWICYTCDLVITLEKAPLPEPFIEDRKGITNHFEITDLVNGEWEFFSDAALGGSITIESASGELRILEAFWVVEYQPFFDVSSSVPDVFADVTGKVPTGNPADIAESIVTAAAPQGMGLPPTAISRVDYNPAKISFDTDGVRADFTISEQINTLELLQALADQCDFRQAWSQGKHRIVRKPAVGGLLTVDGVLKIISVPAFEAFRDYINEDVLRDTLAFSRTDLAQTRTRFAVKFNPLPHTEDPGGSLDVVNDTAELEFGRREEARDLNLIRDAATAELVVSRDLLRRSTPRWLCEFFLPLFGLELALGDLVSLDHLDFDFAFGEVLDASVETVDFGDGPFITVKVKLIVWEK